MRRAPLVAALALCGCDDEITVKLQNLWPEVDSVFVYGVRDGVSSEGTLISRGSGLNWDDKLRLLLPQPRDAYAQVPGPLRLHFDAQAKDGCVVGVADQEFPAQTALPKSLSLPVIRVDKGCRVTVRTRGQTGGIVRGETRVDDASSARCGALCYLRLPFDQDASLLAEAGAGGHFAGWGGDCAGRSRSARCALPRLRAPVTVSAQFDAGLCTSTGALCWENPLPQGHRLNAVTSVTANGAQTLYAVGESGTLLRRDAQGWTAFPGIPGRGLFGVSAASPQEVWAVGEGGTALHLEEGTWKNIPTQDGSSLFGVAAFADRAWAVGLQSRIYVRYVDPAKNKQPWNPYDAQNGGINVVFRRVSGRDARSVWHVGEKESLGRYRSGSDDFATQVQACGSFRALNDLFVGTQGVWAVGAGGAVLRFDAQGKCGSPDTNTSMIDLQGVAGIGEEPVFAVGGGGTILQRSGTSWQGVPPVSSQDLTSIVADAAGGAHSYIAAGEGGEVLVSDGRTWVRDPLAGPAPTRATLRGAAALSPDALWAVGDGGVILHYDGAAWRREVNPDRREGALRAIWASGEGVFAVGDGGTLLQRGTDGGWSFLKPPLDQTMTAVAATGALLFVGSADGRVFCKAPGQDWLESPLGSLPINALWAGGGRVLAATPRQGMTSSHLFEEEATTRCLKGMNYVATGREDRTLFGLFGRGPGDLWAVGDRVILHRRSAELGAPWSAEDRSENLRGGADLGSGGVFVAGSSGVLLRSTQGGPFQVIPGGTQRSFLAAAGAAPDHLILVGDRGAVLRYTPPL